MLLAGLTCVLFSAAPIRLAAPGFALVNIEEKLGSFFNEHVAQQLKLAKVEVVTQREMQSLLGLERQKQLLGCGEQSTCMAELADALGADGMLLGDLAKVGQRFQINLKIIGAGTGNTLAVFSDSVSSEDQMVDALSRGAYLLAVDVSHAMGRPPPPELAGQGNRRFAWAPLVIGVLGVAGGTASWVVSENAYQHLKTAPVVTDGAETLSRGKTTQSLAVAGFVLGGVALAGAAVLFFLGAPAAPVSVAVSPHGASVVLRGEF